ncbi:MAG: Arm DNA-binding domain-containing protein [Solimonas sp.]
MERERGLFVLVHPNGGKWRRFAYSFKGKEKRPSLGTFPLVSLPEARSLRDEARRLVTAGIDPSEQTTGWFIHGRGLASAAISIFAQGFEESYRREWC